MPTLRVVRANDTHELREIDENQSSRSSLLLSATPVAQLLTSESPGILLVSVACLYPTIRSSARAETNKVTGDGGDSFVSGCVAGVAMTSVTIDSRQFRAIRKRRSRARRGVGMKLSTFVCLVDGAA